MKYSDPQKLKLSRAKIKAAKKKLRHLQRDKNYSLRQMAAILGNKITFQSLGRFINEKDYIPSDEKVRSLLDLYADPNPYRGPPEMVQANARGIEFFQHEARTDQTNE